MVASTGVTVRPGWVGIFNYLSHLAKRPSNTANNPVIHPHPSPLAPRPSPLAPRPSPLAPRTMNAASLTAVLNNSMDCQDPYIQPTPEQSCYTSSHMTLKLGL